MKDTGNLKNQLKYWRRRRGFTIERLADAANVSTRTIIKMENNEHHIPRPDVISRLTEHLNITVEQLIVDESETEAEAA